MSSFIQNQKRRVIAMIITVIMVITGAPVVLLAATEDTTPPEIQINVRSGRIKAGTELSFTIRDESEIETIDYVWDRHILNNQLERYYELEDLKEKVFTTIAPDANNLGIHEFSIAAKDKKQNKTKWIDIPYYVVAEDVPVDYVDNVKPDVKCNIPDDYPPDSSTIAQGRQIKVELVDENEIYWIGYKWVREYSKDYETGSTFVYKPGKEFTFTAPQETGEWYLQYYMRDGSNNMSAGNWTRYYVGDLEAPVLTLQGPAAMDVPINGTFVDEGAKWTDNMDGEGIVYANEQLDTSKVGHKP